MKKVKLFSFLVLLLTLGMSVIAMQSLSTSDVKSRITNCKPTDNIGSDCTYKGLKMYGKVKFVESFPDIKVQIVNSFPDLKVQTVNSFPDACGKWQIVESFPDIKVQIVNSFPDIKIQYVDAFPGLP
jgi:hypothetical protein